MHTSNFAKYNHMTQEQRGRCVSIAIAAPYWYKGRKCPELAPPAQLLDWWKGCDKTGEDQYKYMTIYQRDVLTNVDPQIIVSTYAEDAILLCWEAKGKFCHRRIVAEWLEHKLGIEVKEL